MIIPGIAAKHCVITDESRALLGTVAAFHKAATVLLMEYDEITRQKGEKGLNYHLALAVEDTKRKRRGGHMASMPERALPVTPPSTCLPPDDLKPSEAPLGKAQVRAPVDPPSERPPVDPPRKPNRPDPPGKVRISLERGSWSNGTVSCFWHDGCQKMHSAPMRIVRTVDDYTVLECTACGKRGRYPVGGSCMETCDEEA